MGRLKFKRGAASFYIIAFSTLILLTIAMSFAAVIISQVTRTSNDDLSQSAYDSAMAGIEDAKLAYYNYQDCVLQGKVAASGLNRDGNISCEEIIYLVDESNNCDTVGYVLGRTSDLPGGGGEEVMVEESSTMGNNMEQAYTCVKIRTSLDGYNATLTTSNPTRVIKAKFDGIDASAIEKVEVSWYSDKNVNDNGGVVRYTNFDSQEVTFPQDNFVARAMPPTISVSLVQTAENFRFSDFDMTVGDRTDRGMIYLVPTGDEEVAKLSKSDNYIGAFKDGINSVDKNGFLKSNDKTKVNLPYGVYCPRNSGREYLCTAEVALPAPVNGVRSNDTFMFVVSLPYGQPVTDIALRFFCGDGNADCGDTTIEEVSDEPSLTTHTRKVANLKNVQIEVDSTGRANDLYRRVSVRMDVEGNGGGGGSLSSIMGPLELSGGSSGSGGGGNSGSSALEKAQAVTCEWNFPRRGC